MVLSSCAACRLGSGPFLLLCSQPRSAQISSSASLTNCFIVVLRGVVSRSSAFTYGGKTVRLLMAGVREGFRAKPRLQTTSSTAYRQVRLTRVHWVREEVFQARCTQPAPYATFLAGWIRRADGEFTVKSDAAMLCREFLSAHQGISHEGSQAASGSGPHSRSASADPRMSGGQAPTPVIA